MIVVCMITITGRNRKAFRPKTLPPRNFQKCLVPWCPRSILLFPVLLDKLKIVPPYKYILLRPLHHYRYRLHSTKKCILESSAKYILSFNCKPSTIHPLWAFSSMVEFSGKIISKCFQLTLNNCKLVSQWRQQPKPRQVYLLARSSKSILQSWEFSAHEGSCSHSLPTAHNKVLTFGFLMQSRFLACKGALDSIEFYRSSVTETTEKNVGLNI